MRKDDGVYIVVLWGKIYDISKSPLDSDLDVKYFITGELEENEIGPISSDRFYTNLEVEHCCRYKPEYPKPRYFINFNHKFVYNWGSWDKNIF